MTQRDDIGAVQEGGNVCKHVADSRCCIAETNATLQSNYTPIKNKLKTEKSLVPIK